MTNSDTEIDQDILGETAKIAWKELQLFFAAGKAIYVSQQLDLIDVATQVKNDNKTLIEQWMKNHQVMPVSDDKAKTWVENDTTLWTVVVNPWLLVQETKHAEH